MKKFFQWYFGINIAYTIFGYGVLVGGDKTSIFNFIMISSFVIGQLGLLFQRMYYHYHPEQD